MKHRNCDSDTDTKVVDSRWYGRVRRRRECLKCRWRFTTHEVSQEEFDLLQAAKRDQVKTNETTD